MAREKISDQARVDNKSENAVALVSGATLPQKFDLGNYEVKREVSVPTLTIKGDNVQLLIKIASAIVGKSSLKTRAGVTSEVTVYSMKVIDMTDGLEKALVVPAVFRSELETSYPDGGYVGKCFAAEKLGKKAGKEYNDWSIKEIGPKA